MSRNAVTVLYEIVEALEEELLYTDEDDVSTYLRLRGLRDYAQDAARDIQNGGTQ